MRIQLTRDFTCSSDDSLGDWERHIDIDETTSIREALLEVLKMKFVQYSASHQCAVARADHDLGLLVPVDSAIIENRFLSQPLLPYTTQSKIHFSFKLTREQERLYGDYRRKKLFGPNCNID